MRKADSRFPRLYGVLGLLFCLTLGGALVAPAKGQFVVERVDSTTIPVDELLSKRHKISKLSTHQTNPEL